MTAAALLALSLLATGGRAAPSCESLERHGRVHRAARAVPRPWGELEAALLEELTAARGGAAGERAGEFWKESGLGLAEAPVAQATGLPAGSELDERAGVIVLDSRDLADLWAAWGTRRRARVLRETAARLAPVLVHELAHARLRAGLSPLPPFSEEELLADAEETLYLWAVLARDPDALGLRAFDARVEKGNKGREGWWRRPLSTIGDDAEIEWRIEAASQGLADGWAPERWRLVRGMGGGYDAFRETLREGGVLDGLSIFTLSDAQRERALAETRELRAAHESCLAGADAEDKKDLQGWVSQLSGEELAFEDTAGLRRVAGRYRSAMAEQRRDLDTLRAAPAR